MKFLMCFAVVFLLSVNAQATSYECKASDSSGSLGTTTIDTTAPAATDQIKVDATHTLACGLEEAVSGDDMFVCYLVEVNPKATGWAKFKKLAIASTEDGNKTLAFVGTYDGKKQAGMSCKKQ